MNPSELIPSLFEEACPILDTEIPNIEFNDLFPTYQDLSQMTDRMNRLDVDMNTHRVRLELEKMKRRKLRASMNNLKHEIHPNTEEVNQLRCDLSTLQERVGALDAIFNNELARISSLTYRSLLRIHHLMITNIHYLTMPPDDYFETAQLANELLRTIHQIHTHCNINIPTNL